MASDTEELSDTNSTESESETITNSNINSNTNTNTISKPIQIVRHNNSESSKQTVQSPPKFIPIAKERFTTIQIGAYINYLGYDNVMYNGGYVKKIVYGVDNRTYFMIENIQQSKSSSSDKNYVCRPVDVDSMKLIYRRSDAIELTDPAIHRIDKLEKELHKLKKQVRELTRIQKSSNYTTDDKT
jgi:hypothetical protein